MTITSMMDELHQQAVLPANLLPIGTSVRSDMPGRATGTIVGYNQNRSGFYTCDTYPYVIRWCDGYTDVYGQESFRII